MSMSSGANDGNSQWTPQAPANSDFAAGQAAANIDQHTASSTSTDATWTPSNLQLDAQSQNNLRQASAALDAAYERISQLRNSINALLNRVPPEVSNTTEQNGPQASDRGIGPSHSALLLSGGEDVVEELNLRAQRLRSLIPSSARQRLEDFESNTRRSARSESTWDLFPQGNPPRPVREDGAPAQATPPRPRTPPMPDLIIPRARNYLETRASLRRDLYGTDRDESSTMIGRRVAARVASGSSSEAQNGERPSFAALQQRLQAQSAQIARELENMTERLGAPQRPRRVEHLLNLRGRGASIPSQDGLGSTIQRTLPPLVTPPSSNDPLSSRFSSNEHLARAWRNVVLVDNTEYHNSSPSLVRNAGGEHTYNAVSSRAMADSEAPTRTWTSSRQRVNTLELRDDSRGVAHEQTVLPRVLDWDRAHSDTRRSAWAFPPDPAPQAGQTRRRRGWTRLNADGDEISSEDEAAHTRRLRMRLAYGTPVSEQAEAQFGTAEDMVWTATGSSGSDSEPDALLADIIAGSDNIPFARSQHPPNPLPTPVEEMLVYPIAQQPKRPVRVVTVSKHASLAGR